MQVYNTELTHFGIKGMKWGQHKLQQVKKYNDDYKTKINKIANSKSAHKNDVAIAKRANERIDKRVGKALIGSAASVLVRDFFTGDLHKYATMSKSDLIKKAREISTSVARTVIVDEAMARSVANKYNIKGERVKGSNNSFTTREEVATKAITTAMVAAPYIKMFGVLKLNNMMKERQAGKAAFERWGDRILSDKPTDYSNIIHDVQYTVQ